LPSLIDRFRPNAPALRCIAPLADQAAASTAREAQGRPYRIFELVLDTFVDLNRAEALRKQPGANQRLELQVADARIFDPDRLLSQCLSLLPQKAFQHMDHRLAGRGLKPQRHTDRHGG
jgi:hypothetical protein